MRQNDEANKKRCLNQDIIFKSLEFRVQGFRASRPEDRDVFRLASHDLCFWQHADLFAGGSSRITVDDDNRSGTLVSLVESPLESRNPCDFVARHKGRSRHHPHEGHARLRREIGEDDTLSSSTQPAA